MSFRKLVVGFAVAAAMLCATVSAMAAEAIKIGDLNSYKRLPAFTIPYKNGVDLAVEHINAAGGRL